MPTNRVRSRRMRRDAQMPAWAQRLLAAGELPPSGTPERSEYFAWWYFADRVEGLPPPTSPEGMALVAAAREPA